MKEIYIKEEDCLSDQETESLKGTFLTNKHYNILAKNEDTIAYKPNGEILLIYKKNVLSDGVCKNAWPSLRKAAVMSQNRGIAAGILSDNPELRHGNRVKKAAPGFISKMRARPLKQDGTVSNTNYAQQVESGIIGYFDRNARFPYCRQTAFLIKDADKWENVLPFIRSVDAVFKKNCPERYNIQKAKIEETSDDFVINGTAFTTITVNKNWQTAVHQDKGDLREGFGVLSALCAGNFKGCYFCYPKYKVAVDLRTRDVVLADVHEWHGNTPIIGLEIDGKKHYERISCVFYMRANMVYCGTAKDEEERAKNRKRGDKVND